MKRYFYLIYGITAYVAFLGVFLYLIGFLGNFGVPKSVDTGVETPLGMALFINVGLLLLFGLQHTIMARPTFKIWFTRFIPRPIERSTYMMMTNLILILLFWQWRPIPQTVWHFDDQTVSTMLYLLFALGWVMVLYTTFLINHFDLFGLRQVWLAFNQKEYTPLGFTTPSLYNLMRHPLYVGWMIAFWATPSMSLGHFLFAAGNTAYMLIAIYYEERNLVAAHPDYATYRERVPMLIPGMPPRRHHTGSKHQLPAH